MTLNAIIVDDDEDRATDFIAAAKQRQLSAKWFRPLPKVNVLPPELQVLTTVVKTASDLWAQISNVKQPSIWLWDVQLKFPDGSLVTNSDYRVNGSAFGAIMRLTKAGHVVFLTSRSLASNVIRDDLIAEGCDARCIIEKAANKKASAQKEFCELVLETCIRAFQGSVLKAYTDWWSKAGDKPWSHEYIGTHHIQILDSLKGYLNKPANVNPNNTVWLKAIGMVHYPPNASSLNPEFHPDVPSQRLSRETLESLLKDLGIKARVNGENWQLPRMPGLAFLLAVRNLLTELEASGAAPENVSFVQYAGCRDRGKVGNVYQLQVKLCETYLLPDDNQCSSGPLDHAIRFLQKLQESEGNPPQAGLSGAIWNVSRCKVADISPEDAKNNPGLQLLAAGTDVPACQLALTAKAIEFVW